MIKETSEVRILYIDDQRILWNELWDKRHRYSRNTWPNFERAKRAFESDMVEWSDWKRGGKASWVRNLSAGDFSEAPRTNRSVGYRMAGVLIDLHRGAIRWLVELGLKAREKMTRFVTCVVLLIAINSSPAPAASERCQSIKSIIVRQACYDRQVSERAEKRKPGVSDNPKMMDAVESLKMEDDRLAKKLHSICQGC